MIHGYFVQITLVLSGSAKATVAGQDVVSALTFAKHLGHSHEQFASRLFHIDL